ncbi:MAG: hypothetical protein H0X25_18370 [Acidobacteriales bacterium]|nr:hypothetical protein [Terriglobales bacterium]
MIPASVEKLTSMSSQIVEGTAAQSFSQWNPQHTLIYTYTRFTISRTLKGTAVPQVMVRQIGGSAAGYTQRVAGIRHWRVGDQALLFLRPSPEPGVMSVTDLMQGNFLMGKNSSGDILVSNGVAGVSSIQPGAHEAQIYQGSSMRLPEIEARIAKAVQP